MPKAAFMWIDDEIKMKGKKKKKQANKWEFSWRPRKTHNAQQICRFPVLHTFMRSQTLVWVKTQAKLKSTGANNLWPFLPDFKVQVVLSVRGNKELDLRWSDGRKHWIMTKADMTLRRHCAADGSFTQVVLETVACLVGVGEAGIKRSRPVVLDLLLDRVWHFSAAGGLHRINSMWATLKCDHAAHTDYKKAFISTKDPNNSQWALLK